MKYYFINSPTYIFDFAPVCGIPSLLGILENSKIDTKVFDLNLKHCEWLLSPSGITEIIRHYDFVCSHPNYYFSFLNKNNELAQKHLKKIKKFAHNIDFCFSILKDKRYFSDLFLVTFALRTILTIITYSHAFLWNALDYFLHDTVNYRTNVDNPEFEINIKELISFLESDFFPFKNFLDAEIDKIISEKPDIIGISINHSISFFSGIYIAYKLKQKTKIHINIGGSFFSSFYKLMINLDELFGIFCDSISVGNNTKTVLDLIKTLENKLDISKVPNLIHFDNNKLFINLSNEKINMNALPFLSFEGYQTMNYLTPAFFIPILASVSCYWHKCNFCEFCNKKYDCKSPEKIFEELKFLSEKYNTKYFYFWDSSMHPNILSKLADLIIKNKLKVRYSIYARFEEAFNLSLLKKLKESGCLFINFGLDAGSEQMLKIINKGISLNTVKKVLKATYQAGIGTNTYLIFGHPYEKIEDIEQAFDFLKENKRYIDNLSVISGVTFVEGSKINQERKKYKEAILIPEKDRREYAKKLKTLFNSGIEFICYSIFSTLYIDTKGIHRYRFEKKLFFFLRRFSIITKIYISFYKFLLNKKRDEI